MHRNAQESIESAGMGPDSTLPSLGYSMWNPWKGGWTAEIPDGFHGMVDGFHGFSTWIPYFFHMDSILFHMDSIGFPHGFHME